MGKLIAYLGGMNSGKSALAEERFAAELKRKKGLRPAYLATYLSSKGKGDRAMQERIRRHRARRPASWETVEIGTDLAGQAGRPAMLLDGLGMWVALCLEQPETALLAQAERFARGAKKGLAVLVLDEAGQGGVSMNAAARRFAQLNGRVNQLICAGAGEVWRVDAGIASRIK
jgi:adenosyl cobinamide kinase/adenosyl cobinamide phosphate guanylyltransferase